MQTNHTLLKKIKTSLHSYHYFQPRGLMQDGGKHRQSSLFNRHMQMCQIIEVWKPIINKTKDLNGKQNENSLKNKKKMQKVKKTIYGEE